MLLDVLRLSDSIARGRFQMQIPVTRPATSIQSPLGKGLIRS
jgi:hypothetical protein